VYRLNGRALKTIHDRTKNDERSWSERLERLENAGNLVGRGMDPGRNRTG
jgi:hypothetical protein